MIVIVGKASPLWKQARQHTLKVAPREINKSYNDYACAISMEGGEIIAYVFFWCHPPNMGAIHRFAFKPNREDVLLECIKTVHEYLEGKGVREMTTYISGENEWELELYRRMGFGMTTIRPMLRMGNWWRSEGLDQDAKFQTDIDYKDLRRLGGEQGLMSHNLIEDD